MARRIGIAIAALVALCALVWITGSLMDAEHVATRTAFYPRSAAEIWLTVTDWRDLPKWRSDVDKVRALEAAPPGRRGWIEIDGRDELEVTIVESRRPTQIVFEVGGDMPLRGSWTLDIEPLSDGSGCHLSITERGTIAHPVTRLFFNAFMDPRGTITTYLEDLAARFGDDPEFVN